MVEGVGTVCPRTWRAAAQALACSRRWISFGVRGFSAVAAARRSAPRRASTLARSSRACLRAWSSEPRFPPALPLLPPPPPPVANEEDGPEAGLRCRSMFAPQVMGRAAE